MEQGEFLRDTGVSGIETVSLAGTGELATTTL